MGGKTSMVMHAHWWRFWWRFNPLWKVNFLPHRPQKNVFSLWMYMWSCKLLGVLSHLLHILHLYLVDLCLNKWCEFQFLTELKILPQPWIAHIWICIYIYAYMCQYVSREGKYWLWPTSVFMKYSRCMNVFCFYRRFLRWFSGYWCRGYVLSIFPDSGFIYVLLT